MDLNKKVQESDMDKSMRNEDLSIIDDEMPIKNCINKNLKQEYVQDLIEKI